MKYNMGQKVKDCYGRTGWIIDIFTEQSPHPQYGYIGYVVGWDGQSHLVFPYTDEELEQA